MEIDNFCWGNGFGGLGSEVWGCIVIIVIITMFREGALVDFSLYLQLSMNRSILE